MTALRLRISGRVQGVGYRQWMVQTAAAHGVSGWVRNRSDGTVEALVSGEAKAVAAIVRACDAGPGSAAVKEVRTEPAEAVEVQGFRALPSAP